MFKSVTKLAMTTACAAAMTFSVANAQGMNAPANTQTAPPPAQQEVQVTPEQIDSYVEARAQIDDLATEYQARFQSITDPEEGRAIQAEMNQEMATVVEGEGLTVQEYNAIAMAAQQDPAVQQRVQSKMAE